MIELLGYTLIEQIHQGAKSDVFRANRGSDGRSVILKIPRREYQDRRGLAELHHERTIAARVIDDGIVAVLALERSGDRMALVLEDFGGVTLRQYIDRRGRLVPESFLAIALQLCDALTAIHRQGIIHKDIKPQNLLINPTTGVVKITDFSIASTLEHEEARPVNLVDVAGTLAYMAPEQTGRMNRGIDPRTDFYALGVTFYELLTGQRPFRQRDALQLIHAHIALTPVPVHEVCPDVPRALSAIVTKLMAKSAEDRYQDARGLQADLERCLALLREHGGIADDLELGAHDRSPTLRLSQRLHDRDAELHALAAAFDRVAEGATELVVVSGQAGVGKSALVHELRPYVMRRHANFVTGKFEQFGRSVPFAAVAEPFRVLARQLLGEPDELLTRWRTLLCEALGVNAQVVIGLVPELEAIVGRQPPPEELPPTEAQNRVARTLQVLARVLSAAEHPLVLFLDDLQRADRGSLKLCQSLLSDPECRYMLVIVGLRDDDPDALRTREQVLGELRLEGTPVHEIRLAPLGPAAVRRWIAEALGCDADDVADLADVLHERTVGNPFFLRQFLLVVYRDRLLAREDGVGSWRWDLAAIRGRMATDNVVALMASKIAGLSPGTQRVLWLAACIGSRFDLRTLITVCETTRAQLAVALAEALREGLVTPQGSAVRFLFDADGPDESPPERIWFRFIHDRVQQAAYALVRGPDRDAAHLRVGRLMLADPEFDPAGPAVFETLGHLNIGASLISQPAERLQVAGLNLMAGERARTASAYEAAAVYFRAGSALIDQANGLHGPPGLNWAHAYRTAFALTLAHAECEALVGDLARAEVLFDELLGRAREDRDAATVHLRRMLCYLTLGKFDRATAEGRAGLVMLDMPLPDDAVVAAALAAEFGRVQQNLAARPLDALFAAPIVSDDALALTGRVLMETSNAAFHADPTLFTLLVVRQVNLAIERGHLASSGLAYTLHGYILAAVFSQFPASRTFGQLGLSIQERTGGVELRGKIIGYYACYCHYFTPLSAAIDQLRVAYEASREAGNFTDCSYTCNHIVWMRLGRGDELGEMLEEVERSIDFMVRTRDVLSRTKLVLSRQLIHCLQGRTRGLDSLSDDAFDEGRYMAALDLANLNHAACWYYTIKLQLAYLASDHATAIRMAAFADDRIASSMGFYFLTELAFYTGLTAAALALTADPDERDKHTATLARHRGQLALWAEHSPENYRHKHLLLAAESARVAGDELAALDHYEQAIDAARAGRFPHHEAIACELCAAFHRDRGRTRIARIYLEDACAGYLRWGAAGKAAQLREHHPELQQAPARTYATDPSGSTIVYGSLADGSTSGSIHEGLDLASVLKASHAFADEMDFDRLVEKVMHIAVENAGAERGVLILDHEGRLEVVAVHSLHGTTLRRSDPLANSDAASSAIALLSHRTATPIVLEDAAGVGPFIDDSYVRAHRSRSLLCTPILRQGRALGVLYLENNLTAGAFSAERLEVLRLLSTGIAISIENARLYTGLRESLAQVSRLSRAYSRFVPPEMLSLLGKSSITEVQLGDHVACEIAILFADIRAFTALSEGVSPRETFEFVNGYLAAMSPIIRESHGYIDKYIGDAIMALFPRGIDDALQAAVAMQRRLLAFNAARAADGGAPIEIRIGVHFGVAILGTVGEQERMEGTVLSDAVNTSARLERLCELFGAGILVSAEALARSADRHRYGHRFLGSARVKGKTRSVEIFEIFDGDPPALATDKHATRERFDDGVRNLGQGAIAAARACFAAVLADAPGDAAARYLQALASDVPGIVMSIPAEAEIVEA